MGLQIDREGKSTNPALAMLQVSVQKNQLWPYKGQAVAVCYPFRIASRVILLSRTCSNEGKKNPWKGNHSPTPCKPLSVLISETRRNIWPRLILS